jgi:benzoyl-CoA reductase/2-hydroxyglutaryl-CoA dehydratase subunit BcrC/BadD/HgdB
VDIKHQILERKLDGIIAYTQSFCHRQLDIISLKRHVNIPILQIEADQPGIVDERLKLRIESYVEMISFP